MANDSLIVCRRCGETISRDAGHCPHCGQSIRGTTPYVVVALFGLVVAGASVFDPGQLLAYGIVGLLVAVGSGYVVYEQRQRIKEAGEQPA
jgi:uncharacterized paraquat-inducible protein A